MDIIKIDLDDIKPYIRYVNNYEPVCSYKEKERIIYDHELMYVTEGETDICYDGVDHHLKKGDVFYFRPFVRNYMTVDVKNKFKTNCIHFDWYTPLPEHDFTAEEFYMNSVIAPGHEKRLKAVKERPIYVPEGFDPPVHITGVAYQRLAPLFTESYYMFMRRSKPSELKLRGLFMQIIAELSAAAEENGIIHPKIMNAAEYIRQNYDKHITVRELSDMCGLSTKYFGALFKKMLGKSVNEFLLLKRVEAAKELLMSTELSIDDISRIIGFDNQFYFSRCFKETEGITPSGYRSMILK